jgi:hypothetical protein
VHPLGALAIFGAVLLGAWFPAFWSMGLPPPPRTANVIYFIFLIGWFFNTQVLIQYLMEKRGIAFSRLPLYSLVLLFAATGMYVLPENNVRAAWGDLVKGRAARYDRDMRRRYEAIRRCGGSLCEVDDLTARPSTLLFTDITKDEKFWANGCVADVFERKAVRIRRPSVP